MTDNDSKTTPPKKTGTTRRRRNRKPHELAVDSIIRMPLGELARTADHLAEVDEETARFFLSKLQQRITAIDETPVDKPRGPSAPTPPSAP